MASGQSYSPKDMTFSTFLRDDNKLFMEFLIKQIEPNLPINISTLISNKYFSTNLLLECKIIYFYIKIIILSIIFFKINLYNKTLIKLKINLTIKIFLINIIYLILFY